MLKDALERPETVADKQKEHRRMMWRVMQSESPSHAEFVKGMVNVFGKPKRLIYECNGRKLDSAL